MSAAEALRAARASGVRVTVDGESLVLEASAPPPHAVLEALSRYKVAIVALLRPTQGRWSGHDWRTCCVVEWLNQHPAPSPPGRCAWCGRPESPGAVVLPFGTEPGTHAWLHAECWPAWHQERMADANAALRKKWALQHGDMAMSAKKPPADDKKPTTVVADDPDDLKGTLKRIGGSQSDHWNNVLGNQALQSLWIEHSEKEARDRQYGATIAGLIGIGPKDEIEGMIAAQLIAAHNAAMECYRRAMIGEQTFEGHRENLTQANKLSRTYAVLLDALNRHRGKGQQKVTVEHVHVHAGGQAVVGMVEAPGGDQQKSEDQPHAKQIAHAPQPAVWSADKERVPVPVASDGKRPVPTARRDVAGSTKGQ